MIEVPRAEEAISLGATLGFFLVLLALRLVSVHQARRERREQQTRERKPADEPMVRCGRCNVYLPKSSAVMTERGYGCGDAHCAHRR